MSTFTPDFIESQGQPSRRNSFASAYRCGVALLLVAGIAAFVISCQDGGAGATASSKSKSPTPPPRQMPAEEAHPVVLSADTTEGLDPAITSLFAFPAAPGKPRSAEDMDKMNAACVACHTTYASKGEGDTVQYRTMHATDVKVTCVDCHGGHWDVAIPTGFADDAGAYEAFKDSTHVHPRLEHFWPEGHAGNPEIGGPKTMDETADYVRFINPGDLRAAHMACGLCHNTNDDDHIVDRVQTSMMTHGGMLWGAALYNNGAHNRKNPMFGEFYANQLAEPPPTHHGDPGEGPAYVQGIPARVIANPRVTYNQLTYNGMLPQLFPLPRWEITQPGNVLRVFERGGKLRPQIGQPFTITPGNSPGPLDDPGRPEVKLSIRGYGTDVRTDPVFIGLQKTRLMDPTLNMMGTNNHPGDYRASGCSACHVVYANDRSVVHSGQWAKYGNLGQSFSKDPAANPSGITEPPAGGEQDFNRTRGQPIEHVFVKNAPTTNCISCHMHPGTLVVNSYLGYMWWDNESDAKFMYPKNQKYPSIDDHYKVHQANPEGSAVRGLWSNHYPNEISHAGDRAGENFLENVASLNPKLERMHFGDFHGHGWVFRAVFKQDRQGHMLDALGQRVEPDAEKMAQGVDFMWKKPGDRPPEGTPVHLKDIHLEMGMHCTDCHFNNDSHGDGNLYGETRNAVMVDCVDCHGTTERPANALRYLGDKKNKAVDDWLFDAFTGAAAKNGMTRKQVIDRNKKIIDRRFTARAGKLTQKGVVDDKAKWVVVQTSDTFNPDWRPEAPEGDASATMKEHDTERAKMARFAHTVRRDGKHFGGTPETDQTSPEMQLAHGSNTMTCYACHTSWNTSCFGCHLPQRANQRRATLHNEASKTRNYTNYNFQTLRDDVYMLGVDSTVRDHKVVPIRSACAVLVSSQDALRQWIYSQQQTVSAEGFAGTAFSPYFPHTVRSTETKQCVDCHVSEKGDNNAIMSMLMLQGTNSVNFLGHYAYVAAGHGGVEAVAVTERDEPQAVIGSTLHKWAYPDFYEQHLKNKMNLKVAFEHHGSVLDVQQRGEYLYAACGKDGFIAYDIANIDNKGFSERITTAPVSPVGQRFYVKSKYATSITSPSTLAIDPTRPRLPENEEGKITKIGDPLAVIDASRPIPLMYAFLYLTDREEGLIVIGNPLDSKNKAGVATLLDGNPDNNFLERALTFNPDGLLKGARGMNFHGQYAYVVCDAGVVVVDFHNPLEPKVVTTLSDFNNPKKIQFQFRYGFVVDDDGLKVLDVTFGDQPKLIPGATLALEDARDIYISRTYGYVAGGKDGMIIVDLANPEKPVVDQVFNADGEMNDTNSIRTGMTNASMFAYVADGENGMKVVQLTSPDDTPTYLGFSPKPNPRLIAKYHTHGPALAIGEGLDRDRAADEEGNQLAVFGRRGARPFTLEEQQRLYLRTTPDGTRSVYTVSNLPGKDNVELKPAAAAKPAAGETPAGAPAEGAAPKRRRR